MGRLFSPKYTINPSYGLSKFDGNFVPLYFDLFGPFFAIVIEIKIVYIFHHIILWYNYKYKYKYKYKPLFRHDARRNVHGLQLLKQQLACIRNFHIRKLGAVLAHVAAVYAHLVIHGSNHAAPLAHVHLVLVR